MAPLSVISQYFLISVLKFSASTLRFDITAMSSVATATMVCSSDVCQQKTEWSAADLLNPSSFIKTLLISWYHPHPACFNPYRPFSNLRTFPFCLYFNTPCDAFIQTVYLSGAFRQALLTSTCSISQSCWVALASTAHVVGIFAAAEKVSEQLTPSTCLRPPATIRIRQLCISPFGPLFIFRTSLQGIAVCPFGKSSTTHVPNFSS